MKPRPSKCRKSPHSDPVWKRHRAVFHGRGKTIPDDHIIISAGEHVIHHFSLSKIIRRVAVADYDDLPFCFPYTAPYSCTVACVFLAYDLRSVRCGNVCGCIWRTVVDDNYLAVDRCALHHLRGRINAYADRALFIPARHYHGKGKVIVGQSSCPPFPSSVPGQIRSQAPSPPGLCMWRNNGDTNDCEG